jgi:hypothetical protein
MERDPWQPDPEEMAARLEGFRGALRRAQEAGAPAYLLERYMREIGRIERWLAEPQPEPEPRPALDDLSRRALIHAFTKGLNSQPAPSGAMEVGLEELADLPLYIPNVPSGLPPDEEERLEAATWAETFSEWTEILAGRWRLHGALPAALARVANRCDCSHAEVKLRLARLGLLEAMASADETPLTSRCLV